MPPCMCARMMCNCSRRDSPANKLPSPWPELEHTPNSTCKLRRVTTRANAAKMCSHSDRMNCRRRMLSACRFEEPTGKFVNTARKVTVALESYFRASSDRLRSSGRHTATVCASASDRTTSGRHEDTTR
eukprot:3527806-Rhodomonas_salina.1